MEAKVIRRGKGELLGWHDPDEHREWVDKNKSRNMFPKVLSAEEAVKKFIKDGDFIAIGGFGHVRVPMVLVYEIIRQKKRNLAVSGKTAVHDLDVLIGGGCVDRVEAAYSFGHELRGLSPCSRRKVQTGKVRVVAEISNAAYQWRYLGGAMGVPFIPARNLLGTDTFEKSSSVEITDPFSGKSVVLIPSANPDVVMIHVPRCDKYGNSQIDGNIVEDFELARCARRLIISTEEIVDTEDIRKVPDETKIPFFNVDAVVLQKYGSHPCQMPLQYFFDEQHIAEWLKVSRTDEGVEEYMQKYVHGVKDYDEYLQLFGREKLMDYLSDVEHLKVTMSAPWMKVKTEEKVKDCNFTPTEMLATVASASLEDGKSVFVGTGLPMIAAMLAQRTYAPKLLIIFEAGGIGPQLPVLPISVGDSRTFYRAIAASSMHDVMGTAQNGYVDFGFLGAAQIDIHGNINTTIIGKDWQRPKVRMPGSGGANDVGSWCRKVIIIMRQDKQKFAKKIDFLTTPGYLDGPGAREKAGLPVNTGPYRVITQLAVYDFDDDKRMRLISLHPGVTVQDVLEASSFDIVIPDHEIPTSPVPTEKEQKILREVDPAGIVIT